MHLSYLNCVNCEPASFLSFCFRRSRFGGGGINYQGGASLTWERRNLLTNNHYVGNIFLSLSPDVVIVMVSY